MELNQISASDQVKQFKEFLQSYNSVTEFCFIDCVNDFSSRKVSHKESDCSTNCLHKYLKATARISQRFQEHLQNNMPFSGTTPGAKPM